MSKSPKRRNRRKSSSKPPTPKKASSAPPVADKPKPLDNPARARVGMIVEFMWEGFGPFYGQITHVEADACMVRIDKSRGEGSNADPDGEIPNFISLEWEDVLLADVQPADVPGSPKSFAFTFKPGTRVKIDVGDGNDDKVGTIFFGLPQCGVVHLDDGLKYGGSRYAAAEWHLITAIRDDTALAMDAGLGEDWISAPAQSASTSDNPRVIVPIGARVAIQTGETDKEGIVVATLPQCCVVWLDSTEDEPSIHTAADWHFIKPLNLGGEGEARYAK